MLRLSHLALLIACLLALVFGLSFSAQPAQASLAESRAPSTEKSSLLTAGCIPGTFTNRVLGNGLGSNWVYGVYAVGSTVYAATDGGLSISMDGGNWFVNRTTWDGLGSNEVRGVYALGAIVYAATGGGLSISTDWGNTFVNKTTADGLGDNHVYGVYAIGATVYAATAGGLSISNDGGSSLSNKTVGPIGSYLLGVFQEGSALYAATTGGLSISTDGANTFTNKTTADGLGDNWVHSVDAVGSTVYAATNGGLSISTDGGNTFVNKTMADGLGRYDVHGVYAVGKMVYAATYGGVSISTDGGNTFVNKTTANGLDSEGINAVYADGNLLYAATVRGLSISTDGGNTYSSRTAVRSIADVYAVGSTIYAATDAGGLSISIDGGNTWANRTIGNGLGNNSVIAVYADGSTVYAATGEPYVEGNGLSISTDGGQTFTTRTTANGLGSNRVNGVYAVGSTIYAATGDGYSKGGGLSISTDGGNTFINKTTADGLGYPHVYGVYAVGSTVYAATPGGLSISTDGGNTFANKTTANGLGDNRVSDVYAVGSTVYAATVGGLSISTDSGNTFVNRSDAEGVHGQVNSVYTNGTMVYAATYDGLAISTDGGNNFVNKTREDGLGSDGVLAVYATGITVYAATSDGLSLGACDPALFPGDFNKSNPADGAANQPMPAILSWGISSGATSYEYCLGTTKGTCTGWANVGSNTTAASWCCLIPGTIYYWQVRARNAAGTTVADGDAWWSFTTQSLPGTFSKIGPPNGSTAQPTSLTLSWNVSTGGTSYEYCFDATNNSTCDGSWTSAGTSTSANLTNLTYYTTYYWQARARNGAGTTEADNGTWWNFTTVSSVANDEPNFAMQVSSMPFSTSQDTTKATTGAGDPVLSCIGSKGAASVWFLFSPTINGTLKANTANSNYDTVLAVWRGSPGAWSAIGCNDNTATGRTSALSANLIAGNTYYVEAAGRTHGGSLKFAMTYAPKAPAAVKLVSPANSSQSTSATQVLDWTDSPGAAYYKVQVRKDTTTGTLVLSAKPTASTYTTQALTAGPYYWRVGACNAIGCRWSAWWTFRILVPVRPALQTPANGSTPTGAVVTLDWSDSTGATYYQVQVRKDTTSGSLVVGQKPTASTFTTPALLSGHWYYWRVRACSPAGCSAWTGWWKFKVR